MSDRQSGRRANEVIENGVEGLYNFLYRLFSTFWLIVLRRRAARELVRDRGRSRNHYVYPFTYAAIGIFLLSVVVAVAGANILDWIWFGDEISQNVVARLREGVSLVAIAIGSIPAFLVMLAIAGAITPAMRRTAAGRRGRALFLTCYAIGTQAICLFLAATILATGQVLPEARAWFILIVGSAMILLMVLSLTAAVVVPVRFLWLANRGRRVERGMGAFRLLSFVVASLVSFALLPSAANLPTILADAVKPLSGIELKLASDLILDASRQVTLDLLIANPGGATYGAQSRDFQLEIRHGAEPEAPESARLAFKAARVDDEAERRIGFTALPAGGLAWRRARFIVEGYQLAETLALFTGSEPRCVIIRIGSGSGAVESSCIFAGFEKPPAPLSADQ